MAQIREPIRNKSSLLKEFEVSDKYNSTENYSRKNSHFSRGKYPPDWGERRDAIWWLQDNQCGRCGCQPSKSQRNVHHVTPLSKGGNNNLSNLVGLCIDCHALMHPENDEIDGDWRVASKYPAKGAVGDVAVIKRDGTIETTPGVEDDLEKLGEETELNSNPYAVQSSMVYNIGPNASRDIAASRKTHVGDEREKTVEKLNSLLLSYNRTPENVMFSCRRLTVRTPLRGFLGRVSLFEPECVVEFDNNESLHEPLISEVVHEGPTEREYVFSDNVDSVTVIITGGDGETTTRTVSFSETNPNQTVSIPVSPPSLSTNTLGSYPWDADNKGITISLFRALLWLAIVPVTRVVVAWTALLTIFSAVMTVVLLLSALLLGNSWTTVGQIALCTGGLLLLDTIGNKTLKRFEY